MTDPRDFARLAFLNSPDATLILARRVIMRASQRVAAVFGWTPREIEGQSVLMLYPGQTDFDHVGARAEAALRDVSVFSDRRFMRRKDGQIVWMEGRGTALDRSDPMHLAVWTYRPLEGDESVDGMTPAEKRVARYLVNGLTSKEIAQALACSPRTVEVHRANMMRKMGVRNSSELVARLLA